MIKQLILASFAAAALAACSIPAKKTSQEGVFPAPIHSETPLVEVFQPIDTDNL